MDPQHATIIIRKGEPTEVLLTFPVDTTSFSFAGVIRQGPEPSPVGDLLSTFAFGGTTDNMDGTWSVLATAPSISPTIAYTEACFQFTVGGQTLLAGERVPILDRII